MNTKHKFARILLLILALALVCAPLAMADPSFQAVVSVDSMSVYAKAAPHALLGALPRGTQVTVTAYNGSAALILYNGRTGVARIGDMSPVQAATPAEQTPQGRAVVSNRDTRVYKKASTSSAYSTVQAGTTVQLLAVNGNCARVLHDGKVGYMVYSHLGDSVDSAFAADTAEPAQAQTADTAAVQTVNMAVVTNQQAVVYTNADSTGASRTLSKGTKLTLLAVRGDCAMVERNGAIGYTSLAVLAKDSSGAQAAAVKTDKNPFPAGSNEHQIYAFLTGEMGYNRAAAMGVMANIKYESGYRTVIDGDGGTSYGLCQWHAGRKTNLINYCTENGLDYNTVEGQMRFLKYELTTRYTSVHGYLKQVENTAEGAYDAGYYFCFNFEAPAARTSQSTKRGTYARDTLFNM